MRVLAIALAAAVAIAYIGFELFKTAVPANRFKYVIVDIVQRQLGVNIDFKWLEWTPLRPGIIIHEPYIRGGGQTLGAEKLEVVVSATSLMRGAPRLSTVALVKPVIPVSRNSAGVWNLAELIKILLSSPPGRSPDMVMITGAKIIFRDEMVPSPPRIAEMETLAGAASMGEVADFGFPGAANGAPPDNFSLIPRSPLASRFLPLSEVPVEPPPPSEPPKPKLLELRDIDLYFKRGTKLTNTAIGLKAVLYDPELNPKGGNAKPTLFDVSFKTGVKEPLWDWKNGEVKGVFSVTHLHAESLSPYLDRLIPESYKQRIFSGRFEFDGKLAEQVGFKGELAASAPIPPRGKTNRTADVKIDFGGQLFPSSLSLEKLDIRLPEGEVHAKAAIADFKSPDPEIDFSLNTGPIEIVKLMDMAPPAISNEPIIQMARNGIRKGVFAIDRLSFKGPFSSLLNITASENVNRLSAEVSLADCEFVPPSMSKPVEKMSGKISVNKGDVVFNNLQAQYGKSRVNKMNGTIDDFMGAPLLKVALSVDMDAGQLRDEAAERATASISDVIRRATNITGAVLASADIEADLAAPALKDINIALKLNGVGFTWAADKPPVKNLNAEVRVARGVIDAGKLAFETGSLRLSGALRVKEYLSEAFEVDAAIVASGDATGFSAFGGPAAETLKGLAGPVTVAVRAEGKMDDIRFDANADVSGADVRMFGVIDKKRGVPLQAQLTGLLRNRKELTIASGEFSLNGSKVPFTAAVPDITWATGTDFRFEWGVLPLKKLGGILRDFDKSDADGALKGALRFYKNKGGLWRAEGRVAADVASLNLHALEPLKEVAPVFGLLKLEGRAWGNVTAVFSGPLLPDFYGAVHGEDAEFFAVLPKKFHVLSGTAHLRKDVISFNNAHVTVGDSEGKVTGSITLRKEAEMMFAVKARRLNLEDLIYVEGAPMDAWFGKDGAEDYTIAFIVRAGAEQGKILGFNYNNLELGFRFSQGLFRFSRATLSAYNGWIRAHGTLDINGKLPVFHTAFAIDNMEMEPFFSEVAPHLDKITGRLDAQGELSGVGLAYRDLRNSLDGNITVSAENGLFAQFKGTSEVLKVLNVVPLFEKRGGRQKGAGLPFDTLKGAMKFYKGTGHTKDLALESATLRLSGTGELKLGPGTLDFLVAAKPFTAIDSVISNIPIAGHILTGEQKSLITNYYRVRGKITEPEMESVPGESLARGVFGILQRILEAPARALSVSPDKPADRPPPSPEMEQPAQ